MPKGKRTCKILKEIRKQIAEENDINLVIEECTYQGDCTGTCPRCEAEVRFLEQELEKRQRLGKAVMISGLAVTTMLGASSCRNTCPVHTTGIVYNQDEARIYDSLRKVDSLMMDSIRRIEEEELPEVMGIPPELPSPNQPDEE